ncbi:MAG: cytochrome c biogenesis protein ResB [Gammaproteobacteria bacterium]|nr:cytochrome c biogenesis protein ResB [Gammaproteobacteria bacterium]
MKIAKIHPSAAPRPRLGLVDALASNRSTLLLLFVLALAIVVYYQVSLPQRIWIIALPTGLLIMNFLLALATRDILKNNWPLMIFHFALIALVLLAFTGRMSFFKATLELAEHEEFSGQLENVQQGPWHRYGLSAIRFTNLGFQIRYHAGIKRDKTVNQLMLTTADGLQQTLEIGDHVPLIIGHYRFYTSHNKGYAPVFEWQPFASLSKVVGSIHLPAYPTHEFEQALEWTIPETDTKLWAYLKIEENVLPEDREFNFQVPQQHQLVLRYQDHRYTLRPGDELELPGGILRYEKLSTWMGYKVDYDWTRPWLLATAMIGLLGLFVHFILKFNLVERKTG